MIQEIKAAKLDTVFLEWKVAAGDRVESGSVLCMVKLGTMKRTVTSKFDGVVTELLVQPGDAVPGGALICRIDAEEKPDGPVPVAAGTMVDVILDRISGKSAIIKEWYKEPGDDVRPGEPIVSAEAGKLSTDISSPYGGTLQEILAETGTAAAKGSVVARITADGTMIGPEAPRTKVAVIGGGPGGYVAAIRAAQLGADVTLIEKGRIGGTCLNAGCIPTKALLHSAENYQTALNSAASGVLADNVRLDWKAVQAYRQGVSDKLIAGVEGLLTANGVTVIKGTAKFAGQKKLAVQMDGKDTTLEPDKIIIATGSGPVIPPIPGLKDNEGCIDSTGALMLESLPSSMIIIGGGVIGIEFACFYADLGCEVTVIEALDRLLPVMDRELGQNLGQLLKKQGVRVLTGARVQRIEEADDGLRVAFEAKSGAEEIAAEAVICAIGRKPCLDGLFAEGLQPETDGPRLAVNERFETSIPGVYAIGDAACPVQFAHLAAAQGESFAEMLAGLTPERELSLVPSCVHCRPEIAVVGLSEAEAKAAGIPVKVGKCVMGGNARTLVLNPGRSFMKVVAHAETGAILGAQLMCPNASDIISQLGEAIANRMTPRQLLRAMRPHPTFEEALGDALSDLDTKLNKS